MAKDQNTLIVIGDMTTSTSIKPSHIAALNECSQVSGWPLHRLLNEALSNFISDVVPVLMEAAERNRKQRV